ncbi:MAG: phosphatidate cytidylyltransferase, partial [Lentisphaeria bacterium]|nr:phosphatidate cytidylyltransferase [Lentisphaeria bacterium]
IGDAFAALIGKRFGKHRIRLKFADCRKSVEGTAAMFVFSALSVFIILLFRGGPDISACAFISVVTAAICALVELFSKNGFDTVTCPAATMAVLVPLCSFFSQ